MSRASYLLISEQQLLRDWAQSLRRMFVDWETVYQVGSSLERRDFRDVDVRHILDDDLYDRLAAVLDLRRFRVAVSIWGQRATGLPIDYEIQRMSDANAEFTGRRNALLWPDRTTTEQPDDTHDTQEDR